MDDVRNDEIERIKALAKEMHAEVFPNGEKWSENILELKECLEDRYKFCREKKIPMDNIYWTVWCGRFNRHCLVLRSGILNEQEIVALKYLHGVYTTLNQLLKYQRIPLLYRSKIRKAKRQLKKLRVAFFECLSGIS